MNINEIISKYHKPFGESVQRRVVAKSEIFKYKSNSKMVSLRAENHLIKYTINGVIQLKTGSEAINMKSIKAFGRKVWNKIVEIFTMIKDAIVDFVTRSKDKSKKIGKLCKLMKTIATKNKDKEHVVDRNVLPIDMSTAVLESRLYAEDDKGELLEKTLYTIPVGLANILRHMAESYDGIGISQPTLHPGQAERDDYDSIINDIKELEKGFSPKDVEKVMLELAKYAETDISTLQGKISDFNNYCLKKANEIPKAVIVTSVSERVARENSELIETLSKFIKRTNVIKDSINADENPISIVFIERLTSELSNIGNLQLSTFKKLEKASSTIHLALFKEAAGLYKILKM